MQVRAAAESDMAQVAAIYAHYVATSVATFEEEPPPADYWQDRLAKLTQRNLPFLVAEAAGDILGYSFASPWRPRPAYRFTAEDSVYVAPGQAGRGVGSALMKPLLDHCVTAGVRQVIAVIADTGDDASRKLHARFGFIETGVLNQVGYKHGRWIDTLLMQRRLQLQRPGVSGPALNRRAMSDRAFSLASGAGMAPDSSINRAYSSSLPGSHSSNSSWGEPSAGPHGKLDPGGD